MFSERPAQWAHRTNQLPQVFSMIFPQFIIKKHIPAKSKQNVFLPRVNLNDGQFGVKYAAVSNCNEFRKK